AKDRILQCHICNLPDPPSPLIEPYLREANFWHVTLVGRGCKWDPKLVNMLVERWKTRRTHSIFHAGGVCGELLGSIPEMIYGGQIEMAWLRRNFARLDEDSTKVKREQHAWAYIFQIIGGILMLDKSQNVVHL
ncbi:hypothetical protein Gogos_021950, partial [Gossypium gossypioides]|nr:hypothetical protein [Gossypium gossypioides]